MEYIQHRFRRKKQSKSICGMSMNKDTEIKVRPPLINFALFQYFRSNFPHWTHTQPNGLLCVGGDLLPERLLAAYCSGFFPWYNEDSPILWWSPNPRCIVPIEEFHLPRRSIRTIRKSHFHLRYDHAFEEVIGKCAVPRNDGGGTWIVPEMREAYILLHKMGYAHSIETWQDGVLVGGLYGVGLGRAFFGESMFYRVSEASRYALFGLIELLKMRGVVLLDSQMETPHMMAMGAVCIQRRSYQARLQKAELGQATQFAHLNIMPWLEKYSWDEENASWISPPKESDGVFSKKESSVSDCLC